MAKAANVTVMVERSLVEAIRRLQEALRFYADEATWAVKHSSEICDSTRCGCSMSPAVEDEGQRAREALQWRG